MDCPTCGIAIIEPYIDNREKKFKFCTTKCSHEFYGMSGYVRSMAGDNVLFSFRFFDKSALRRLVRGVEGEISILFD